MCFLLMSEGRRFPDNARLIYETGFGRRLKELAAYLQELDSTGTLRVPDPDSGGLETAWPCHAAAPHDVCRFCTAGNSAVGGSG